MNAYVLTFGGAEDEFFSAYENTDRALDALEPLLFSAVWAAHDVEGLFHVEDDPADARFEGTTVYHMINDYEFDKAGLTQAGGNVIVTAEVWAISSFEAFGLRHPRHSRGVLAHVSHDAQSG
jgi:hypothetical protein